ncbi:SLBB domain-containing protein [Parvibium lacunae]|uniref:Polysaccharide transporter n=1 Tax=Parvibium lacunae TaxID=1888893 RepID=A0A368L0G5_9BURK|nr:SLBB domain-containing protein [Parvibium lacunae]RCS57058.1 polysaccharide transporter [Parvibium lacunae]
MPGLFPYFSRRGLSLFGCLSLGLSLAWAAHARPNNGVRADMPAPASTAPVPAMLTQAAPAPVIEVLPQLRWESPVAPVATTKPASPTASVAPTPLQNTTSSLDLGVSQGLREVVGVGDQLAITVFGHPDLSGEVTVSEASQLVLPLIGSLDVRDKTPAEIAQLYAQRLVSGNFLREPRVAAQLRQQRSRQISVLGEVQKPGRYALQGRVALLDAISLAGGVTPRADKTVILIRRQTGQPGGLEQRQLSLRLDDPTPLVRQQLEQALEPDDVIYVAQQKVFYIHGEVRRPGVYPIEDELTVMRAISIGGGITERGSARRIMIYRAADKPPHSRATNDDKAGAERASMHTPIRPGDVIFVDERIF